MCGWDFGFNHPSIQFAQMDSMTGRYMKLREFLGDQQYLDQEYKNKPSVVDEYRRILKDVASPTYPVIHYGDPHGADAKDNALSSIETLRVHHKIHVLSRRARIKVGLTEIQHKVSHEAVWINDPNDREKDIQEKLFLVDYSCVVSRKAYMGGYHRDETGEPNKDGYYDHVVDGDRYVITGNMSPLANRRKPKKYRPRNKFTGY